MSEAPKRPGLTRAVKALIWFASLVLTYTVAGVFIVPAVIKSQMVKRLPAFTHRQATVKAVILNPFTFSLTVSNLSLLEANGDVFAGFDQFHAQFQALASISARAWVLKDVTIVHPFAQITRRKDGGFNFDNLIPSSPPDSPPAPAPSIPAAVVESLRIDGAALTFDDLVPEIPFHDKLAPVNLQVTPLSTQPNTDSPFTFFALTDAGESIAASGQITVPSQQSSGHVQIAGLSLKRYAPYLAPFTIAEILDGKLDGGSDYQFALGVKGLEAVVTNGAGHLTAFKLKAPDSSEPVVSIPGLTVDQASASLAAKSARVHSVKSSGGALIVRRNKDGGINLLALLKPQPAPVKPAADSGTPWTAQVDEVAFDNYDVQIEDLVPASAVKIDASDLAFRVTGFNSSRTSPMAVDTSMRLNGRGTLSVAGTATLAPLSADVTLDLAGLELPVVQPYLAGKVNVGISSGQLKVRGKAHYGATATPLATFAGDVSVTNMATTDKVNNIGLAKFDSLAVNGIDFAFQPNKIGVQEIRLAGLDVSVLVLTNRQINLLGLVPQQAAATATTNAPANALAFPVALGAFALDNASVHVLDRSIEPNCVLEVGAISGSVQNLSTQPRGPATVDLHGRVGQFSPFSITGTVDPLSRDIALDLAMSGKNIDLTTFSSYLEKYGGHPLKKGKVVLDLRYDVSQRKLVATNKITVADLTLGPKNNSPDATSVPITLGVALLKDRNGNITLDVPLTGNLDSPDFRVFPLVWKVIMENLAKAAASPFTLLGSLVGGKPDELSSVDFPPGSAVLSAGELAKLRKLGAALYERPGVNLEIAGSIDPASDIEALARIQVHRRIQELRARELSVAGKPPANPDTIHVEPADYTRLLRALYVKAFGTDEHESTSPFAAAPPVLQPGQTTTPVAVHHGFQRGSELLMHHTSSESETGESLPKLPVPAASPVSTPSTPTSAESAQMEQRLVAGIRVTDDELRDLMQARARAVEAALVETGKVSADRVTILAPKSVNRTVKGEPRANFSVE
jgi:hypothetical protein